jgi:nitroimidazol reductase NimA-like FMN-containing flavoprotein (pyridoxamine 5'-phosphate oxidase superfamily)
MRRKDRQIPNAEARAILERGEYGVLSTVGSDGRPYGVPVSYCVIDGAIYFHCAVEGHKLDNIHDNPRVSFCVVGETEPLPAEFATRYESCIVHGVASESFGEEKQQALEGLVQEYSADFVTEGLDHIEQQRARARVYRIAIESISGKARK